ncbi:GNAT family N-acetyltransferase [Oscillochloris sp. ZM17-4]|uniref:GNAT family N-acetyltransferase n=1 Tax=Oscillochloris sp. ZM17-4 TaxID=2866714 RepID=UPI001C732034|nr:GNAT family N-acetyltransferase [Oscillochloris sp. ZM17-4]MBX0326616.1 GNAT family N-acetyltransferase [Oscillochloris sp. ZM17-4]
MREIRPLARDEVTQVWSIDRREVIERVYYLRDGALVLEPEYYDMQGWPPGSAEKYTPLLLDCYDRGGAFVGAFDGETLAGVAVLDTIRRGPRGDLLQLEFLHVGRDYRGRGLGRRLFAQACDIARERGARGLYVSATPSEHTVHFYHSLGCALAPEPDPELFALEPEDIHLVCPLERS